MTHGEILKRTWQEQRATLLAASRKGAQASKNLPQRAQLERAWRVRRTKARKVTP